VSRSPTIRVASFADLPQVTSLRQQWSANRGFSGDTGEFAERVREWWERQGDSRVCWLALDEELAIGMANLAVFERMPHVGVPVRRWGYVRNVWVDPVHRRRGVATALMTAVIDWCRARSFERIVLNPSQVSVPMYHGLGFRPADELLRLDL
jgi:GNAT superfamily N-acetyltransferase